MLFGIGFLTVITAAITSAFIARARREFAASDDAAPTAEQIVSSSSDSSGSKRP